MIFVMPKRKLQDWIWDRVLPENCAIIAIASEEDKHVTMTPAQAMKTAGLIKLTFADITMDPGDDAAGVIFDDVMVSKIIEFVKEAKDKAKNWIVSCDAGISRSGAVGLWLARYLEQDEKAFYKKNPQVKPNPHVLRKLTRATMTVPLANPEGAK